VLAHSGYSQLPRTRAQALFRLAALNLEMHVPDRARKRIDQLREEGLEPYLPARLAAGLPKFSADLARASNGDADS